MMVPYRVDGERPVIVRDDGDSVDVWAPRESVRKRCVAGETLTYSADVESSCHAYLDGPVGHLAARLRAIIEEVEHRARVHASQDERNADRHYNRFSCRCKSSM